MDLSRSGSPKDSPKEAWDKFWKSRGPGNPESWAKSRIKSVLAPFLKPGINVLDAGCGSGFFSAYFISCGCSAYSMDYSKEALLITENITSHKSKGYIKASILDEKAFSGIDAEFDIIFTDGLMEHYSKDEQGAIIRNLKAVKKEHGYMINFVPNRFSFWSAIRPFCMNVEERPFVMKEFLALHAGNGMDIVSYGGINVLPFRVSPEKLLGKYMGMLFYCVSR